MRISVCIPTYQRPVLLQEAVLSAATQDRKPFEILIGDDSRTDETEGAVEILRTREELAGVRLRYEHNRPSLGQAANVQSLMQRAEGDVLTLIHDDDRYRPGAFAALAAPLEADEQAVGSFGRQVMIKEDGTEDWEKTWAVMTSYGKGKDVTG